MNTEQTQTNGSSVIVHAGAVFEKLFADYIRGSLTVLFFILGVRLNPACHSLICCVNI